MCRKLEARLEAVRSNARSAERERVQSRTVAARNSIDEDEAAADADAKIKITARDADVEAEEVDLAWTATLLLMWMMVLPMRTGCVGHGR